MYFCRQEIKQGRKAFLLWALGIGFLIVGGMVKFLGVSGTQAGSISGMLAAFPRPVLAIFGMAEVNIETFGGFYAILQFYVLIAMACYAIHLSTNAVLREQFDKTYEFLFTKPCGRLRILSIKLLAGLVFLTLLCALNLGFSYLAPPLYGIENEIWSHMPLFALSAYLVSLFFYALGAALSVLLPRPEGAVRLSYAALLFCYGLSVLLDMDERLEALRFLTPFKYFRAGALLSGHLSGGFTLAIVLMAGLMIGLAFARFKVKDLKAA